MLTQCDFRKIWKKKHIIVSSSAAEREKKLCTRFFLYMTPLSIPGKFQDVWIKIVGEDRF